MIFYNALCDVYVRIVRKDGQLVATSLFVFEPGVPGEYSLTNAEQLDVMAGFSSEVCEQLAARGCPEEQAQALVKAYFEMEEG